MAHPMAFFSKPLLALAMGGCLIASCSPAAPPTGTPTGTPIGTPTGEATRPAVDTFMPPNVQLPVMATAGNCPDTVDLWVMSQAYEGGADHTVVADFLAIATGPTEILSSEDLRISYVTPLREEFAACVGTAKSESLAVYSVRLGDGKVHFTLNLEGHSGTFDIRYADVSANRPYIYWRAASP
jgi:hypothetical protein